MPTSFARRSSQRRYSPGQASIAAVIWLMSVAGAAAQTVITSEWNTSSGFWNVPANWAPADVPDNDQFADYDVLIGNRAVAANATVRVILEDGTLDAVNNLTLSNGAALFTNGQFIFVNGQTLISNTGTQLRVDPQSGGTTAFRTGTLVVNNLSTVFMDGGLMDVASSITINAGGTLTGFGTVTFGDTDATVETALQNSGTIKMSAGINPVFILQRTGVDRIDLDGTSETGLVQVANATSDVANDTLTLVINSPLTDAFSGTIKINRRDTITFNNNLAMNGAQVDMDGNGFTATMNGTGDITSIVNSTFNLAGDVVIDNDVTFTGAGNTINLDGASWRSPNGGSLNLHGALNVLAAGGQASSISVRVNFFVTFGSDSVTTLNNSLLVESNNINVRAGATFSGLGALRVGGVPLNSTARSSLIADDGAIINVPLINEALYFVGGISTVGRNTVGSFQQTAAGESRFELEGTGQNQFDQLVAPGVAQLAGLLVARPRNGFIPVAGQSFDIIKAQGGVSGQFDTVESQNMPAGLTFQVNYGLQTVFLVVVAAPPSPTPTATPATVLGNISTRLRVETGNNVLIGGFIITGTQSKKVIVRAIGPSLSQFFAGTLANPTLELRDQQGGLIAANDDWKNQPDADRQAVIDSTVAPTNDLESALVRTLPANGANYTVIVSGANNGTGIGVVEAFDLDRSVASKLANISTRGFVQTDPNILIAGTIIVGSQAQKVLIRAIGPSLSQFFAGTLANPTLELRDQNGGLIAANDDWKNQPDSDRQAVLDTTIPPANDLESALVRTLPANNAQYTAIVRGVNGGTGIAVVEVYALN